MITFGIALLLAAGLGAAKICQLLRLPSVTGYILAGLLLGPTGINFITEQSVGHHLDHFTHIALMLIAFGIGEHIELKKLKEHRRSLLWIGVLETSGAFLLVTLLVFGAIRLTGFEVAGWSLREYIVLSILFGAVGVATAPAATLLVIQELRARGPLTSTLMAIVAIDDGLAIMIFGLAVTAAHQILGQSGDPFYYSVIAGMLEILGSLLLGLVTGICLVLILSKLQRRGEIMTAGLAILLLCSELATFLHFSPLLSGMAAGFILVNKAERDVRIFRALNQFEPPIYVLFFTLAGTHLDIKTLGTAGIIGIIYFLARICGKIAGVAVGARIGNSLPQIRRYLGFALLPQAGVAIGLVFLLASDQTLTVFTSIITPVVLAGVFLSELIGPVSARFALTRAGETGTYEIQPANGNTAVSAEEPNKPRSKLQITPWSWQKLKPPRHPHGIVAFSTANPEIVRGLARLATIFANYYRALPMAIHVQIPSKQVPQTLFLKEHQEVQSMGYTLTTEMVPSPDLADGLITAIEYNDARAVVMGYPLEGYAERFNRLLDLVSQHVFCPVLVVRFFGELHTERILVPFTDLADLADLYPIVVALDTIGEHRVQLLYLGSSTAQAKDLQRKEEEIRHWLEQQDDALKVQIKAVATESRVEIILDASANADIVVIGGPQPRGVHRFLFGSLAASVAKQLQKTLIVVYNAGKESRGEVELENTSHHNHEDQQ